jgi:hypothetical protein
MTSTLEIRYEKKYSFMNATIMFEEDYEGNLELIDIISADDLLSRVYPGVFFPLIKGVFHAEILKPEYKPLAENMPAENIPKEWLNVFSYERLPLEYALSLHMRFFGKDMPVKIFVNAQKVDLMEKIPTALFLKKIEKYKKDIS